MLRSRLAGWRTVAIAGLSHPRLAGRLALYVSEGDAQGIADIAQRHLSERDARLLSLALLDRHAAQVMCDRDGLRWVLATNDWIGRSIYVDGGYSSDEIGAVLAWLNTREKKRLVVEVGANIGTTTLPLARAGYDVLAIEPVPSTFALLSQNVAINGFSDRVRCVNRAVAAETGEVEMWVTKDSGLSEIVSGDREPGFSFYRPAEGRVTVAAGPLDAILGHALDDVALVWSDTQGYETSVIETGGRLWRAGVPLYLEVAPWLLEMHGGLDAFIEAVEGAFAKFLTRDALLAGATPSDIGGFGAFARSSIAPGEESDALLLPS